MTHSLSRPTIPQLLLITDLGVSPDLTASVTAALQGGAKHILLRMKGASVADRLSWAKKLYPLIDEAGGTLLISGCMETTLAFPNTGLHLPEQGASVAATRSQIGPHRLLGQSCHSVASAQSALQGGADYVTLSPIFATQSHPEAQPLGVDRFQQMRQSIPGPVLALGGITELTAPDALAAKADGLALIRGVFDHPDPQSVTRNLLMIINGLQSPGM